MNVSLPCVHSSCIFFLYILDFLLIFFALDVPFSSLCRHPSSSSTAGHVQKGETNEFARVNESSEDTLQENHEV